MRKIARLALLGFASGAAMGGGILLAATTAQAALIEREITIAHDESQISGGEWGVPMVTYDVPATLNEGDTLRTSVIFGGGESLTLFNSDPTYWVVVFSRVGLPLPNSFTTVSEGSLFFTGVEGFPLTKPSTGAKGQH